MHYYKRRFIVQYAKGGWMVMSL